DGGGGAAVAGLEALEVAADLAGADGHPVAVQGLGEWGGGPGAVLADQLAEQPGDALAAGGVRRRAAAAGEQGLGPAGLEVVQDLQHGAIAVAEVAGDAGRLPAGVGEGD